MMTWVGCEQLELHSRTIVVCYHCTLLLVYEVVEEEDIYPGWCGEGVTYEGGGGIGYGGEKVTVVLRVLLTCYKA